LAEIDYNRSNISRRPDINRTGLKHGLMVHVYDIADYVDPLANRKQGVSAAWAIIANQL
jgi:hypothetical protein|tara:strand:+ start:130 stop:306 length:177 start_codon:yes stop_codon:yes gene_type:complete